MDLDTRKTLNALLTRLSEGDRSAFEGVFALLWPAVSGFCAKMLPHADAEDAAQLALLKVFDRASTFDPARDGRAWAITIAAFEVRTLRQTRRRQRVRSVAIDEGEAHESPLESPEALISERQLTEAAFEVLGGLSEADQETLRATFHEMQSADGVAGATFRKRRERALTRLRDAWRRIYGD